MKTGPKPVPIEDCYMPEPEADVIENRDPTVMSIGARSEGCRTAIRRNPYRDKLYRSQEKLGPHMLDPIVTVALERLLGPAPDPNYWGGGLGWLQVNEPAVYERLYILDKLTSGLIFGDSSKTVSWEIATRAKAGNPICIALCKELDLLSPNHCQKTLDAEAVLQKLALRFT